MVVKALPSSPPLPLPPLPPGQSPFQHQLTNTNTHKAQQLSSRATTPLLALLGSPQLKAILKQCCGTWADRSPAVLLQALREYVSNAEVVHNFEALASPSTLGGSGATCVDLPLASQSTYLPNLWEVEYLNATSGVCSNPSENNAEVSIFGFQPFSASKTIVDFGKKVIMPFPGTYQEATERPVYAALNLLREDVGSGNFGSVGLVLSRQQIDAMLLLSPQDTGSWECACNSTAPAWLKKKFPVECSTWKNVSMQLGSADHFDHTLLTSFSCWVDAKQHERVGHLFARAFAVDDGTDDVVNMTRADQLQGYIEADVAGAIHFPDSVNMVIGDFRTLFGSTPGVLLQDWCKRWGWPLVWAFGGGNGTGSAAAASFRGLDRIVDVLHLNGTRMNRTVDATTLDSFHALWSDTQQRREEEKAGPGWGTWVRLMKLVGQGLVLRALPGGRPCLVNRQCYGIDQLQDCVCPV